MHAEYHASAPLASWDCRVAGMGLMSHLADGPIDWAEYVQPRCFEGPQEPQVAQLHRGDTKGMAGQKQSVKC